MCVCSAETETETKRDRTQDRDSEKEGPMQREQATEIGTVESECHRNNDMDSDRDRVFCSVLQRSH